MVATRSTAYESWDKLFVEVAEKAAGREEGKKFWGRKRHHIRRST